MPRPRRRPAPEKPLPLCAMTPKEREIIDAFLHEGSFKAAGVRASCHEETVSEVWHRYRRSLRPILQALSGGFSD